MVAKVRLLATDAIVASQHSSIHLMFNIG
jgi:hypothetical protein